jgi:hypothetical protein
LPGTVEIPVNRKVRAIFFLHAGGFFENGTSFATYEITGQEGLPQRISLTPALPSTSGNTDRQSAPPANIVDWYPNRDAWRNLADPAARLYFVTQDGDPLRYERYLTTLACPLSREGTFVRSITITADPRRGETLAVLGITLALPLLSAPE